MCCGILASLDRVCHSLPVSIKGFVPPVIHLPVLDVMDGGNDTCLRPLLVNLLIQKHRSFELENQFL